jgi:hypothetical protein
MGPSPPLTTQPAGEFRSSNSSENGTQHLWNERGGAVKSGRFGIVLTNHISGVIDVSFSTI